MKAYKILNKKINNVGRKNIVSLKREPKYLINILISVKKYKKQIIIFYMHQEIKNHIMNFSHKKRSLNQLLKINKINYIIINHFQISATKK